MQLLRNIYMLMEKNFFGLTMGVFYERLNRGYCLHGRILLLLFSKAYHSRCRWQIATDGPIINLTLGVVPGPETHKRTLEPDPDYTGVGKGSCLRQVPWCRLLQPT